MHFAHRFTDSKFVNLRELQTFFFHLDRQKDKFGTGHKLISEKILH
jgi:hypothetical protein